MGCACFYVSMFALFVCLLDSLVGLLTALLVRSGSGRVELACLVDVISLEVGFMQQLGGVS